ncbi:MAG: hypothetical protein K9G83_02695 [Hyphomonadaceae bacterium]|nr:hypothetical protein [Hyphomonadaceae bacterium]
MTLRHKGIHAAIQTMKLENSLMTRNFDEQTTSAALALIGQYGSDAEVIAVMRAAEYAALGDAEALAAWDDIIACVAAIEAGDVAARPIQ